MQASSNLNCNPFYTPSFSSLSSTPINPAATLQALVPKVIPAVLTLAINKISLLQRSVSVVSASASPEGVTEAVPDSVKVTNPALLKPQRSATQIARDFHQLIRQLPAPSAKKLEAFLLENPINLSNSIFQSSRFELYLPWISPQLLNMFIKAGLNLESEHTLSGLKTDLSYFGKNGSSPNENIRGAEELIYIFGQNTTTNKVRDIISSSFDASSRLLLLAAFDSGRENQKNMSSLLTLLDQELNSPKLSDMVGAYHGGISRTDLQRLEDMTEPLEPVGTCTIL